VIESFARLVPDRLSGRSGSVFYSGRTAFGAESPLYVLGLNPGGDPAIQVDATVGRQVDSVLRELRPDWCAYLDEAWGNRRAGAHPLQRRVVHVLENVGLDPRAVPASNVTFLRSRRGNDLPEPFEVLAATCWPFHDAVIGQLSIGTVLCFGRAAGWWVRQQLDAHVEQSTFVENNARRWKSTIHRNRAGIAVVTAAHPSVSDWTTPAADIRALLALAMRL